MKHEATPIRVDVRVRYRGIDTATGQWADHASSWGSLEARYEASLRENVAQELRSIEQRADRGEPQLWARLYVEVPVESIDEAKRLGDARWRPAGVEPPEPMVAHIPGTVTATYRDGHIDQISFTPSASDAGYHGPSFTIIEAPESYPDEEDDRPFWAAVQQHLAAGHSVEWTE